DSSSDLGIRGRFEKDPVYPRDRVSILRQFRHSDPVGMRQELLPCLITSGHIVVDRQVREAWQTLASDILSEEDALDVYLPKDVDLTFVKHLDLSPYGILTIALVDTQFKKSW